MRLRESYKSLTSVIPVTFYVPICVHILGTDILLARDLDLFEAPLWQNRIISPEITSKHLMLKTHPRRQRVDPMNLFLLPLLNIINDLDYPVIIDVTDGHIAIRRYLIIELGDRCRNDVRV